MMYKTTLFAHTCLLSGNGKDNCLGMGGWNIFSLALPAAPWLMKLNSAEALLGNCAEVSIPRQSGYKTRHWITPFIRQKRHRRFFIWNGSPMIYKKIKRVLVLLKLDLRVWHCIKWHSVRSSEVRAKQTISMHIQKPMMHLGNKLLLWRIRLSLHIPGPLPDVLFSSVCKCFYFNTSNGRKFVRRRVFPKDLTNLRSGPR